MGIWTGLLKLAAIWKTHHKTQCNCKMSRTTRPSIAQMDFEHSTVAFPISKSCRLAGMLRWQYVLHPQGRGRWQSNHVVRQTRPNRSNYKETWRTMITDKMVLATFRVWLLLIVGPTTALRFVGCFHANTFEIITGHTLQLHKTKDRTWTLWWHAKK